MLERMLSLRYKEMEPHNIYKNQSDAASDGTEVAPIALCGVKYHVEIIAPETTVVSIGLTQDNRGCESK